MSEEHDLSLGDLAVAITGLKMIAGRRLKHLGDIPVLVKQLWEQIVNLHKLVQFGESLNMDISILKHSDRLNALSTLSRTSRLIEVIFDEIDQGVTSEAMKPFLYESNLTQRITSLVECSARLGLDLDLLQA
jgi:hypothetical protein